MGKFAYAFTQGFLLLYNLQTDNVSIQLGNLTWPDSSFLPHAADVSQHLFIVVLGYVGDSSSKYTPCAYLLKISGLNLTVLETWIYTPPTSTSWQASLTNWNADTYSAQYDMSVSINDAESQVLLGIQITNTIVLLNINQTSATFLLPPQMLSNGRGIGMGKTVGWLDENTCLVLVNTYSLSYVWSASQIFTYNMNANHSFTVVSIIPNTQQTLVPGIGPILISLVGTQSGVIILLDSQGNYYIILPSPLGDTSDTSTNLVSSNLPCMPGTFSFAPNILPCSLCPENYSTFGLTGRVSCELCPSDAFCPLGAAFGNISASSLLLTSTNQAPAYPLAPQSVQFENILMENMFTISFSSSNHCLLVSPLFWVLIIMLLGILIVLVMTILKYCAIHPLGKKTRNGLKEFFKHFDLIGEGDLWIGGIVSFAIIILAIFAYVFSNGYFYRYPIERISGNATFACDPTLSNAQFSTRLMSLVVSPKVDELPIFELLNAQLFTLHVDFVNTLFSCMDVTLIQIKDINLPLPISSCNSSYGSLSLAAILPSHGVNLQFLLAGINTIGGVRLALEGSGTQQKNDILQVSYTLVDVEFAQAFSAPGLLLTQQPSLTLQLTKVINRTYPLTVGGQTQLNGIWMPYVSTDINQIFVNENEYIYAISSNTILSLAISETPYYVLNTQQPIVDEAELIFTNVLFTILCMEIFGLMLLIFKVIIVPLFGRFNNYYQRQSTTEKSLTNNFDLSQASLYRF
ncbi:unnamed protein product [Rotaria socialis]|uniref:Uncharacterized protein n=1 Tax=Rotaria socialis TaxID=392032 RepID=A0A820VWF5_9BILA|nr:unnamed protein product [Rotaria socialis]CAF4506928.1 unnamed protein product [Rotaria socialis]